MYELTVDNTYDNIEELRSLGIKTSGFNRGSPWISIHINLNWFGSVALFKQEQAPLTPIEHVAPVLLIDNTHLRIDYLLGAGVITQQEADILHVGVVGN